MSEIVGRLGTGTISETILLVLIATTLALFVVSVAFSAYAVVLRVGHEVRARRWAALGERWRGPVLDALMDPSAEPAVHALIGPRERLHFVQFVLQYSRRVRGEERVALRRLALPYLDEIAARATHRRAEVRTRAVQTLGTLGLPAYAPRVLEALKDPSPLVSMVAARHLARREFPEYAGAVIEHLDRFEGWHRRFLGSMLAAVGPELSPRLRERLADADAPRWLRAVMADALRQQLDPRAGDVAVRALSEMPDRELTISLLKLLTEVGRPEHADAARRLADAPDEMVRAQALHALGVLGTTEDVPRLLDAVGDPSPWVALHAARGLRAGGAREALVSLAASGGTAGGVAGQVLYEEGAA